MSLKRRAQQKAVQRALKSGVIPDSVMLAAGNALVEAIDRAVTRRWTRALTKAAATHGTTDERVAEVAKGFRNELTALGAAAGAAAATPGIGTAAAAGALGTELGWFGLRAADLIMTIAAIHGHTNATVEERRAWVLSLLAFGESAATEFSALANRMDVSPHTTGVRVPLELLERINTQVAGNVLTKFGTRRGMLTVGKLLPFGVGAVVGGGANLAMITKLSRDTHAFFRQTPAGTFGGLSVIDVDSAPRRSTGSSTPGSSTPGSSTTGRQPQSSLPPPPPPPGGVPPVNGSQDSVAKPRRWRRNRS